MAIKPAIDRSQAGIVEAQFARVANAGSGGHDHAIALLGGAGATAARDLADAVHLLCHLYGRHPGLIDIALAVCPAGPARTWLKDTADAFERERLYLVRLTSAVGPLPSTAGAAETEAVLLAQRHAIETLANSERRGCALGATTALVEDWRSIRKLLDKAADRVGIEPPVCTLPDEDSVAMVIAVGTDGPGSERALAFGGEQLLLQHRGLFDLLEARAESRLD
jgi:hypothetical protein